MKKLILCLSILTFASLYANADSGALSTGYFNEGYLYRHRLNPALAPEQGYVSFPGLNMNSTVSGNFGMVDFFRNNDLKNIEQMNNVASNANFSIISFAFYNKSGKVFTSIDINHDVKLNGELPYGFFDLLKNNGKQDQIPNYNLTGLGLDASMNSRISFGQSYLIGKRIRFGYKLHFIMSHAMLQMNYNKFQIHGTSSAYTAEVDGYLKLQGLSFGTDKDGYYNINNPQFAPSFNNFGFGVDLGVNIDILSWLSVSASVNNLGAIFHKNVLNGVQSNKLYIDTDDIMQDPWMDTDDYMKEIENLFKFKPSSQSGSFNNMLPVMLRAGVQLRLPMYERLSFGVLYTQQLGKNTMSEIRGSLNLDPCRALSLNASYAWSNIGQQFGAMITLHCTGFNLFVGADAIPFKYQYGIPTGSKTVVSTQLGLGFQIGKYNGHYPKKEKN